MAASYSIGGLRVDLEMGTAQFKRDAKDASGALGGFSSAAKAGAASIISAFVGVFASLQQSTAAILEMQKTALGLGVTTESFSRLGYAAQQAGLSTDDMKTALGSLTKISAETKLTLDALNVAYQNSKGEALAADVILRNLVTTFSAYGDGVNKTATAVQIFGSEALGRQMIPFLNQTTAALDATAKKADELGKTVSSSAVADAKAFAKAWQDLKDTLSGAGPFMTEVLNFITKVASRVGEFATAVRDAARSMGVLGEAIDQNKTADISKQLAVTNHSIAASNAELDRLAKLRSESFLAITRYVIDQSVSAEQTNLNSLLKEQERLQIRLAELRAVVPPPAAPVLAGPQMPAPVDQAALDKEKAMREAMAKAAEALRQFLTDLPPFEAAFARLKEMFDKETLSAEQFAQALRRLHELQAEMKFNEAISGTGKLLGAMSKLFNGNKAMAIGQAAIDAYTSFNAALKNPPGPPYTIPAAAASLAAGLAQVKSIMSTTPGNPGGGGSASSAAASAGSAGSAGNAPGSASAERQGVYITLEGERYGRDQVVGLMSQISAAVADGAQVVVAQ